MANEMIASIIKTRTFILVLSAILVCIAPLSTYAQSAPIRIGTSEGDEFYIADSGVNHRIGSAVSVRMFLVNANLQIAQRVIITCDGKTVSNPYYWSVFRESGSTQEILRLLRQKETQDTSSTIDFRPSSESDVPHISTIVARVKQLCASATSEPRNVLIPVTKRTPRDELFRVYSLVSGTAQRVRNSIEIWVKSEEYRRIMARSPDGVVLEHQGKPIYNSQLTGKNSMDRWAVNCSDRTMGNLAFTEYDESGKITKSDSISREQISLRPVVPDSIGESLLEVTCLLYR
jgi:hypothetical protein